MDYNEDKISKTLLEIYERSARMKSDKELEEILCLKEEYDETLYECCKKEYINRQNKLS